MHLLRQPVNLPASVAEYYGLCDGDRFVEIAESIQLPFLLLDCDVELFDTFQGQLIPLDENPNWLSHKLLGHLENICGHGGREKDDLSVLREELEDLVDLILKTTGQHLVGFIETKYLDGVGPEGPAVDHVVDTTGGANDNVDTLLQLAHILTDVGSTDAGVTFYVHVVSESDDDLLNLLSKLTGRCEDEGLGAFNRKVELLEDGDGESCGLSSTGLGLSDDIVTLDDGDDRTLLDGRRTLETLGRKTSEIIASVTWPSVPVSVDTAEEFCLQIHVVEAVENRIRQRRPVSNGRRKIRTYRRFDPSWTQFRCPGYPGELLCTIRVSILVYEARDGRVLLGRHDWMWLGRERDEFLLLYGTRVSRDEYR